MIACQALRQIGAMVTFHRFFYSGQRQVIHIDMSRQRNHCLYLLRTAGSTDHGNGAAITVTKQNHLIKPKPIQ